MVILWRNKAYVKWNIRQVVFSLPPGGSKTGFVPMVQYNCLEAARLVTIWYRDGRAYAKLFRRKAKRRR